MWTTMRPRFILDTVVYELEKTMEAVSIVVFITLSFAVANLAVQVLATEFGRRAEETAPAPAPLIPEHPLHARIEGMPRLRTDRHDLQLALGYDFAASDGEHHARPHDPRI